MNEERNFKMTPIIKRRKHRSYFDWSDGMQVVRKGNSDIAMTESELVRFFGVTWMRLNYRLQTIMKSPNLQDRKSVV